MNSRSQKLEVRSEKWAVGKIAFILASLFSLLTPRSARAQFLGYTAPQTITQQVFNPATTTGTSGIIRNFGQSVHYLTYFTGGTVTTLSIQLEGSQDGINWIRISETATDPVAGACFASVYLPFLRADLTVLSGTSPTVTAFYSGTSVSVGTPAGVFSTSSLNAKTIATGAAANTTTTYNVIPPAGSSAGTLYLTFSSALAGASVSVSGGPDATHLTTILNTTALQNTGNTQSVFVGPRSANFLTVTYNSPGATAVTYNLSYQFGITDAGSTRAQAGSHGFGSAFFNSLGTTNIISVSGLGAGNLNQIGCRVDNALSAGTATVTLDINVDNKGVISIPFIATSLFDETGAGVFSTSGSTALSAGNIVSIPLAVRFANTVSAALTVSATSGTVAGLSLTCTAVYTTTN